MDVISGRFVANITNTRVRVVTVFVSWLFCTNVHAFKIHNNRSALTPKYGRHTQYKWKPHVYNCDKRAKNDVYLIKFIYNIIIIIGKKEISFGSRKRGQFFFTPL